jgi:LysM repeat protein/uncharacterized protein YvpB
MILDAERSASAPAGAGVGGCSLALLYAPPVALAAVDAPVPALSARSEPRDLVARYAARTAAHRNDLRTVIHDHRAGTVLSPGAIGVHRGDGFAIVGEPIPFGRGTAAHREAVWREGVSRREARRLGRHGHQPTPSPAWQPAGAAFAHAGTGRRLGSERGVRHLGGRRRAAAAIIGALLLLVGAAGSGLAQARYEVQDGDTLASVAATFGVDPEAIAAASYIQRYPELTPGEVVVIPNPGQSPEEAAREAAALEGTSPWVVAAHVVAPGDTLAEVAYAWGLDAETLAAFNGLENPDDLRVGQRLLIPPSRQGAAEEEGESEATGLAEGPLESFVAGVGTHVQSRNLSCEYAAAFIATSAFGAGVPESTFFDWVPPARNPHYGYRGNIDGWWGNTDDYGVYPEALAPVLDAHGFAAFIFYSDGATGDLTWYLDQGLPVLVWLGLWGDTAVTLYDDGTYTVAAGAHVVVAYGYDASGVHLSDPADGTYKFYGWADFIAMWSVLDGMAMAVAPY